MSFYYTIGFWYDCRFIPRRPRYIEMPESEHLCAAEHVVRMRAAIAGLDIRHEYSFPDGSLYKALKSEKEVSHSEIASAFDVDGLILSNGAYVLDVAIRLTYFRLELEPAKWDSVRMLSIEERFSLSPDERNALASKRYDEREVFFSKHYAHRSSCLGCKSFHPCDVGDMLFKEAVALTAAWEGK